MNKEKRIVTFTKYELRGSAKRLKTEEQYKKVKS